MRVESAKYDSFSGELILKTSDPEARKLPYEFKPGDYEFVKKKQKRSLDANAYAWVLIDKIAQATLLSKEEIYRNTLRDIGGVSDIVCVKNDALGKFIRGWGAQGLGWQTDIMPSKLKDCTNVIVYYGSSTYDTKQMSALIDHLVQDAKALGIETMTPEELSRLTEGWRE